MKCSTCSRRKFSSCLKAIKSNFQTIPDIDLRWRAVISCFLFTRPSSSSVFLLACFSIFPFVSFLILLSLSFSFLQQKVPHPSSLPLFSSNSRRLSRLVRTTSMIIRFLHRKMLVSTRISLFGSLPCLPSNRFFSFRFAYTTKSSMA